MGASGSILSDLPNEIDLTVFTKFVDCNEFEGLDLEHIFEHNAVLTRRELRQKLENKFDVYLSFESSESQKAALIKSKLEDKGFSCLYSDDFHKVSIFSFNLNNLCCINNLLFNFRNFF